METNQPSLNDLKKLRLQKKWTQDQLAEFSGLNVRTIQRIEKGENADLESMKSLGAVFEIEFVNSKQETDLEFSVEELEYLADRKGLLKFVTLGIACLVYPTITGINSGNWRYFGFVLLSFIVIIGVYMLNSKSFFGPSWKRKILDKRKSTNRE